MSDEAKEAGKKKSKKTTAPKPEAILANFQALRAEQRNLATKLTEFEADLTEHKMVIETLKNVNDDRKCYRMIGGILTERKVKEVLPVLVANSNKLSELIAKLSDQLTKKGEELNEFKEKHNIRIRGVEDLKEEKETTASSETRGNVLVLKDCVEENKV